MTETTLELNQMSNAKVQYRKEGHVAYITLNRPEVLNALDRETHQILADIWDDFEQDDNIWLGVLAGQGDRAFSVGQDLKELDKRNTEHQKNTPHSSFGSRGAPGYPRLTERFSLSKPLIAKVHGYALGGGFEIALACDIIIASTEAKFGLTEAKLGLIAGAGGVFRLFRQIPQKIAMGYLMTGRHMSADRAYELGLINEVVTPCELDECVERWVKDMLACAPLSLRAIKQAALASTDMSLEQAFNTRFEWEEVRRNSPDCVEGPKAFVEKRAPQWQGQQSEKTPESLG